jgi:CBS domain-containing protein
MRGASGRPTMRRMTELRPARTARTLLVGAVMTPFPVMVEADTPLDEIAELMAQNDITGVPVVDPGGRLVGVVSQTDMIRLAATTGGGFRPWSGFRARHVMSGHPVAVRAETPLIDAVRRLERHGIHRLVVVGDDGSTPIGVVSVTDLLPLLLDAADV